MKGNPPSSVQPKRTACRKGRGWDPETRRTTKAYPLINVRSQRMKFRIWRGGGTPDQEAEEGTPPQQRALPAHGIQVRGEVQGTPHQEGEGGAPPDQERMTFVHGLINEMGGSPQPQIPALPCSSGVPLPSNGVDAHSPTHGPDRASYPAPSAPLRLEVWGLCRYLGLGAAPHLITAATVDRKSVV